MRIHSILAAGLALAACGPSTGDARDLVKGLEAVATVDDRDLQARLLLESCAEIRSCADGCARGLHAAASPGWDSGERGRVLADCYPDWRRAHHADEKLPVETWFRGYIAQYAARAREKLPDGERGRLDALVAKLK